MYIVLAFAQFVRPCTYVYTTFVRVCVCVCARVVRSHSLSMNDRQICLMNERPNERSVGARRNGFALSVLYTIHRLRLANTHAPIYISVYVYEYYIRINI